MSRHPSSLLLDVERTVQQITSAMADLLGSRLSRRGFVVAMSGGVDSSVCAALAVRAVGAKRVFGLLMPERDSEPDSVSLGRAWAESLGIAYEVEDIAPILDASGCYRRRDDAIREIVPEYGPGWRCKLALAAHDAGREVLGVTNLVVQSPDGELRKVRPTPAVYRQIVAATNHKQRVRKLLEYYHADRLHYAVVGTPNRLEYDQGFFVKGGDGLADLKPIAHLYKTQVYQVARFLGVPEEVTSRPPTTDTFPMPQSQEEFFFALPLATLDRILYALDQGKGEEQIAQEVDQPPEEISHVVRQIDGRRAAARYLHLPPLLIETGVAP